MKTIYIDKNSIPGATSVFMKDVEIMWAGTTISSMNIECRDEEYQKIASEYDVHFIFDDKKPIIRFYTVPMVDIFAVDSNKGYFGSIGEPAYLESKSPVCYISRKKECYLIAENFAEFVEHMGEWKNQMRLCNQVEFFFSKEDAEQKYEFLDISEF